METIELESWEAFELQLNDLAAKRDTIESGSGMSCSPYLYRGHSSEIWSLETTLERRGLENCSFSKYFRLVSIARPTIEAFTNRTWELEELPELREWSVKYENLLGSPQFPGYDYLAYLRHHGFPSPLLDWSASPYIAAYFAFANADVYSDEKVAIFAYMEYVGGGKTGSSDQSRILTFGPYVNSHQRHFLQQSQYTICAFHHDKSWHYSPHENVFSTATDTQDQLLKFTIPATERTKVLSRLDMYNLNAFSLFRSEESLLDMIATKEIDILNDA